jgi:hypothetical protein
MSGQTNQTRDASIALIHRVTCPHCWETFPPEKTLWIAQHPELLGDVRLGPDQPLRFLPTRFNLQGAALDSRGFPCHETACPGCHLPVPRAFYEMPPVFLSMLGGPASGKSYFLASMTWQLRKLLPKHFALALNDADPNLNHRLHEYESMQFLNSKQDELVVIEKTQTHGDLYDTVLLGEQTITYPKPFVFSLLPMENHPVASKAKELSRVLCFYDNAGESFLPGEDSVTSPVTRHLAKSRALMFLFDPTQDMRFRRLCEGKTNDPQMMVRSERFAQEKPVRQETILSEAAMRVRRYAGIGQTQRFSRPLVMVISKYDSWASLLPFKELPTPYSINRKTDLYALRLGEVEKVSQAVRDLLWSVSPEIVSAAESFSNQVIYIPCSSTGCAPEIDSQNGGFGFRPQNLKPIWSEIPLLYIMSRWMGSLIPYVQTEKSAGNNHRAAPMATPFRTDPLQADYRWKDSP